jgi:Fe-S-cluster-containing dehydrogenase component
MSVPYTIELNKEQRTRFVFNQNTCVACQACVLACVLENNTSPEIQWRGVFSFNEQQVDSLPLFHLSLACNHCEEAPCMHNCPALAYKRDLITGAVLHLADNCIGCQYCTWVCPYDAPKFNEQTHIVEKCNFCVDRLHQNLKPACVTACPTGALNIVISNEVIEYTEKAAFFDFGIHPSIEIISLSENRAKPLEAEVPVEYIKLNQISSKKKISFQTEWPLALFTFLSSILVGSWAGVLKFPGFIDKWIFAGLLLVATFLSTFHLGKKARAYRAVFNFMNSWLSREILFWSIFAGLSLFYLFIWNQLHIGLIALAFGFLFLYAVDMVYSVAIQQSKLPLHSASVPLSGLMFFGFASGFYKLAYLVIFIKVILFSYRFIERHYFKQKSSLLLSSLRMFFLLAGLAIQWKEIIPLMIMLFVAGGELIDRINFYNELDTWTPKRMIRTIENQLINKNNK